MQCEKKIHNIVVQKKRKKARMTEDGMGVGRKRSRKFRTSLCPSLSWTTDQKIRREIIHVTS